MWSNTPALYLHVHWSNPPGPHPPTPLLSARRYLPLFLRLLFFCRLLLSSWIWNAESPQCALQKVVAISGNNPREPLCFALAREPHWTLLRLVRENESDHYRLLGWRVTHWQWLIRSCKESDLQKRVTLVNRLTNLYANLPRVPPPTIQGEPFLWLESRFRLVQIQPNKSQISDYYQIILLITWLWCHQKFPDFRHVSTTSEAPILSVGRYQS